MEKASVSDAASSSTTTIAKDATNQPPPEKTIAAATATATTAATKTTVAVSSSSSSGTSVVVGDGHRVLQIGGIPTKRSSDLPMRTTVIQHPEQGNRVTGMLQPSSSIPTTATTIDDFSTTEKSIQQLKESIVQDSTYELMQSYDHTANATTNVDFDTATMSQLKIRIVQLLTELQDRTKWEAIRLKEFLILKEKEISNK